jgi:serine phosphatase RsbU (regulator of sigma subunit)/anti-sigma regulatory factor (Ser/Thr protein kinase)
VLATALTAVMLALSPPTDALGEAGWVPAVAIVAAEVLGACLLLDERRHLTFEHLLTASYIGLLLNAVMVWLAGEGSSYQELYVLWIGAGVGVHPPRRALVFLGTALAMSALPLVWDGWTGDSAREIGAHALLWCAIGAALMVLIASTRAQRAALRSGERNARAEAEDAVRRVRALQSIAEATRRHMSLSELLRELLDLTTDALDTEQGAVLFHDPERDRLALGAATDSGGALVGLEIRVGEGLAGRVAAQRRPAVIDEPLLDPVLSPLLGGTAVGSAAAVPLVADDSLIGILEVGGSSPARQFSDGDLHLLQLTGERMALAIDRARLYDETRHIAQTLQRRLLPARLPTIPGIELAARYLPGGLAAWVGGDWYDTVVHPDGRVELAMGDVVGRGIDAASLMGQLRTAFRAYAIEDPSPAQVLERLNSVFEQLSPDRMATMVVLLYDPESATICMASAGHPPPITLSPDGSASLIEHEHGLPLGVMPYASYPELRVPFEPGSSVMIYTDGLVEEGGAINDGLEALRAALTGAHLDAHGLCDRVVSALLPDGAANDDAALLVLHDVPLTGERLQLRLPSEPDALQLMRRSLQRWLRSSGGNARDRYELTVACGEACANAIEHAYPAGSGDFTLDAIRRNGDVEITVSDRGSWRPPRGHDRGRGIELIRALVDDAEIVPGSEGTTVRLRRKLCPETA